MQSNREIADEALCRAREVIEKRRKAARRFAPILSVAGFALLLCLAALPKMLRGGMAQTGLPAHASVVMLAGIDVGGYVVVGIVAFAAGMIVTIFCLRARERRKP